MSIEAYKRQIVEALGAKWQGDQIKLSYTFATVAEARLQRKAIGQAQKQLRFIKRQINGDIKQIRAVYRAKVAKVQPGFGSQLLLGKGKAKSLAAQDKRRLNQERDRTIAPYQGLNSLIDNLLMQLDGLKLQIDQYIHKSQ